MMKRLKFEPPTARRTKLSYIMLGVGALYLCLVVVKFPGLFESVTVLDSSESGSSMNHSLGKAEVESEASVNHSLGKAEDESVTSVNHSSGTEEGERESGVIRWLGKEKVKSESSLNYSLGKQEGDGGRLIKTDPSSNHTNRYHRVLQDRASENVFSMPGEGKRNEEQGRPVKPRKLHYGRITAAIFKRLNRTKNFTILENMADEAWTLGLKEWEELEKFNVTNIEIDAILERKPESCSSWVSQTEEQFGKNSRLMSLPCGLAGGSSITIIGTPRLAHKEYVPELATSRNGNAMVKVSQFVVELQGLKAVSGEDPPKILHLNPRLRGDWSQRPVIEHNTCYRMHWGAAQRCDGSQSKNYEPMLDGFVRCEKWMRNDIVGSREPKIVSWFQRFIGHANKPVVTWPFPFVEGRLFVLTIRAGVEGYHINIGGRHVTSFPYRTGFPLEDATGLLVKGDVDIHSVYATSLPTSHPSFSPQEVLDFSEKWKANPLPNRRIRMFVGVLSATNHFSERMAVRKTWMQSSAIKSSDVVVRFFVALNPRREVNAVLKKEAAYFGDIVILPFMDRYELVVLKTIAICEYGVRNMTTDYIMKCDDDNFVRIDSVLQQINHVSPESALYMGNLNLFHRPLRQGKWAVSYEEWPEEVYPPYANGPGYIVSIDIAKYIVAQHQNHSLRLFKMEDVSMGMWVEQFNSSTPVQYNHNLRFCQYGCVVNYFTAHYQSPRQMLCLWYNLVRRRARCCDF